MHDNIAIQNILDTKSPTLFTIPPSTSVYDAIALMADKNIGALPIVSDGQLVGMFSERDYTRKVILRGRSSQSTAVEEIMVKSPITVKPSDTVAFCLQLMTMHRVRHLPVLDDGKLVGLVSIGDLVNWIIGAQDAAIQHLEKYVAGTYPA